MTTGDATGTGRKPTSQLTTSESSGTFKVIAAIGILGCVAGGVMSARAMRATAEAGAKAASKPHVIALKGRSLGTEWAPGKGANENAVKGMKWYAVSAPIGTKEEEPHGGTEGHGAPAQAGSDGDVPSEAVKTAAKEPLKE